jgi:hypothetical protein
MYPAAHPAPAMLFSRLLTAVQSKDTDVISNILRYRSFAHNFLLLSALLLTDDAGNRIGHLACAHGCTSALSAALEVLVAHTLPRKRPPKTHSHYSTYKHYSSCAAVVRGVVVNGGNGGGLAPLAVAAACGDSDAVSLLLTAGADTRHTDNTGLAALHVAARLPRGECAQSLITAGADVNHTAKGSLLTPLMCAARSKSRVTVALLLRHGAQSQLQDAHGLTALAHAVKARSAPAVLAILLASPATRAREPGYYVFLLGPGDQSSETRVHGWDVACDLSVDDDAGAIDLYESYQGLLVALDLALSSGESTMVEAVDDAKVKPYVAARGGQATLTIAGAIIRAIALCCFRARDGVHSFAYSTEPGPTHLDSCRLLLPGDANIRLPPPSAATHAAAGCIPADAPAATTAGSFFDTCMRAVGAHQRWIWEERQRLLVAAHVAPPAEDAGYSLAVGGNTLGLAAIIEDMFSDDKKWRWTCDLSGLTSPAKSLAGSSSNNAPKPRPRPYSRTQVSFDRGDEASAVASPEEADEEPEAESGESGGCVVM